MPNMMQNRMRAPAKSKRGIGGVLKELFTYSSKLKVPSAVAFIFAVAGAVLTIIGPNLLSQITDLISDALGGEIDIHRKFRIGLYRRHQRRKEPCTYLNRKQSVVQGIVAENVGE